MFQKVLVANRGEIAVRIIQTLRELAIASVAIYSEADAESLHVQLADEAVCVGGAAVQSSYLNRQNILNAAILTGADAIHPGFGFLAENASFAELCAACQITFIGPRAATIELMGNKANAREFMRQAAVPVIPGSDGFIETLAQAQAVATTIGYPLLLKAAAGGGGKGIRRVDRATDLAPQFVAAQEEAELTFGDRQMYIEKVLTNAKHIEVQVFRDHTGQTVAFPERDCSAQRHHQKVLEESPCILLAAAKRQQLQQLARQATIAMDYLNTGTLEFLMDQQQHFYFMEMNTRIQVEHPVTEMVTGIDLIREQILVAAGVALSFRQADIQIRGHAIECRLNAEDPLHDFMPSAGTIDYLYWPLGGLGTRIDSGVYAGSVLPPFYDSMIAKLITFSPTREQAIKKMARLLQELVIRGVTTTQQFEQALLTDPEYLAGTLTTNALSQRFLPQWLAQQKLGDERHAAI
ncbi:acetyl-CoA carboxylase biotin carboxylase subunit [Loigolactobacillus jiayinensis]|uniref:biotin carboxylase n=1 Tax=Loigolactobacillus jiayinensis TaxID=2486016 RepID=A0ABW1R828_9LACO|nr:acetyl-CoA carboxylase biotin carboxylase subunit [Loigolactobacillus jiayinensis]